MVFGLTVIAGFVVCRVSDGTRDWVKFHLFYRDYLAWKTRGGSMEARFYEPLMLDCDRDDMVKGLSYDQITRKFPFLTDGDPYPPTSYKGQYLKEARKHSPETRVLWFKPEDGSDYGVYISGSRTEIVLVKG